MCSILAFACCRKVLHILTLRHGICQRAINTSPDIRTVFWVAAPLAGIVLRILAQLIDVQAVFFGRYITVFPPPPPVFLRRGVCTLCTLVGRVCTRVKCVLFMQGAVLGVPSKEEARVLLRILAAFALGAKWSDDRPVFFSVGKFSKALMMHV